MQAPGPAAQNGHVALGAVRVDLKRRAAMVRIEAGAIPRLGTARG